MEKSKYKAMKKKHESLPELELEVSDDDDAGSEVDLGISRRGEKTAKERRH